MTFNVLIGTLYKKDIQNLAKFLGLKVSDLDFLEKQTKFKKYKFPIFDRLILDSRGKWNYYEKTNYRYELNKLNLFFTGDNRITIKDLQ